MKVLVTGDRGYIGCVMVKVLSERGHSVTGMDTDFFLDGDFGQRPHDYPSLQADIRDVSAENLAGFDAIVHLAALSNDPLGSLRAEWTYDINHHATVRLARMAKAGGVSRFLYASSCSMYGAAGDDILTEEAPLCPLTPYAISKVRSEESLSSLADGSFSPTFLRNATAYGVSPRLRADLVLNNLVGWAVTSGKIRILSDGTPWRPIVHIEDIARAFAAVLEAPRERVHNQAFNVGSNGENYQVRDLAAAVGQVAEDCAIEYANQTGPDPRNYRVNFTKFERAFPSLRPRWTALEGARELYEAFRAERLTLEKFQGRSYIRVRQLEHLLATQRLDDSLRWKRTQDQ
jgi:nucleoside-diphosphate-sugar epimerase